MAPYSGSCSEPRVRNRRPVQHPRHCPSLPRLLRLSRSAPRPLPSAAAAAARPRGHRLSDPQSACAVLGPHGTFWGERRNSFPLLSFSCSGPFWSRKPGLHPASEAVPSSGGSVLPTVPSGGPEQPHLNPCSLWQAYPGRERGREGKAAASCRALVGRASCLRPRAAATVGLPGGASSFSRPRGALGGQGAGPGLGGSRVSAARQP